ncbi:phage virion morphogenesis protein [Methylomonas sp. MS20]|uniref:phage virion morphogenesis protein n=1 Tax=unclassified Methylomonas TaxID=2608980 RepID=UPI0028A38838|nr:phage virion morphogenesis protein [Methylomonas sp. MV1]MDT4328514.1 phage virion morphogenesis protein [Methylomonas sp. MV1]
MIRRRKSGDKRAVGCAERKAKRINRERCASRCSAHPTVLKKTGRMLQSLIYQADNNELRVWFDGSRDGKLAAIHQRGTEPYLITPRQRQALAFGGIVRKRVNHPGLPKRELIGFPDSDRDLVENVATDHLTRVLQRARGS